MSLYDIGNIVENHDNINTHVFFDIDDTMGFVDNDSDVREFVHMDDLPTDLFSACFNAQKSFCTARHQNSIETTKKDLKDIGIVPDEYDILFTKRSGGYGSTVTLSKLECIDMHLNIMGTAPKTVILVDDLLENIKKFVQGNTKFKCIGFHYTETDLMYMRMKKFEMYMYYTI